MRRISLTFLITLLIFPAFGQKTFTLEDVIGGGKNYYNFIPKSISSLNWIGDSHFYTFKEKDKMVKVDARTGETATLLTLEELSQAMNKKNLTPIKSLPRFEYPNAHTLRFSTKKGLFEYNTQTKEITLYIPLEENAENRDFSSEAQVMAYTKGANLFLVGKNGKVITVTNEEKPGIVCGQSVHRHEFGIEKGTFWSPNGRFLAFYRKDESMVSEYPLVNIEDRVADTEAIRYPMAGMASHHVTIGIYDTQNKTTSFLKTGEPLDRFFTNITWSPDEKSLFIAEVNRGQNHMWFNRYDINTGEKVKTLFEETSDKWVEPEVPALFLSKNPNQFIWRSERDGYDHLYLYDTTGKMIRQLTSGPWVVTDILGQDASGKYLYYMSTEMSPIERHAYKVNIKNGKRTRLTLDEGTHSVKISHSGKYLLDNFSNVKTPRQINLASATNGKVIRSLLTAENPYKDYDLGETTMGTLKAGDGHTDLYYRMIKPTNFDPNKKYPVIVYVYGGPHAQLVHNKWMGGARMWQHYMAQKGYIAFTIDNRGSANRGAAFENVIHRNLGTNEMADQMEGVKYLNTLPFVDQNRIGVHGWSFGGFMTTSLMTTHPEVFKVGVAGGPVIDWKYYEIMYGERYMDTPQENPEGYKNASLLPKAKNLKGHLMMIHGAIDDVVVWQHSLSFVRQCVKDGVLLDYFVYPRHQHNVRGHERIHLMKTVSRYFEDHL